jgi:type IV pilus assembly protein PilN
MIKINLLAAERKTVTKRAGFQIGQKITVGCTLILVLAGLTIAWRYWSLQKQSAQLDQDIAAAQQETTRLRALITQVQQFEQRKSQLQQRVALIEQLRRDQTGPVHMLDQISRSLPPMLWLTSLKQGATANEVVIDGRATTMTGLSDFVGNLEGTGYFRRGVEIIVSQTESVAAANGELIRFSIRAAFQPPVPPAPSPPAPAAAPAPPGATAPAAPAQPQTPPGR